MAKKELKAATVRANPKEVGGRERILQVSARLFREHGYDGTSVRDIAAEVGMLSGSLFHHFASKQAILFELMKRVIEVNSEHLAREIARGENNTERLCNAIACELGSVTGDTADAMALLLFEWRSLEPVHQAEILILREKYEQVWLMVLVGCAPAAERERVVLARKMLAGMIAWAPNWYRPSGALDFADIVVEFARAVLGWLKGPKALRV